MIPLQICYKYVNEAPPARGTSKPGFHIVKPGLTRFLPGLDLFLPGLRHTSFLTWFSTRFLPVILPGLVIQFFTWFDLVKNR